MIKINLDTVKSVLQEYDIPTSELNAFTKVVRGEIMFELRNNLILVAKQKLKTSKSDYINSIVLTKNVLSLNGDFANAIESGSQPYDMKVGFENSSKKKRSLSGGWYLTIPFRIGTPSSSGVQSSAVMTRSIYDQIRAGKRPDTSNQPPKTRATVSNSSGKIWEQYVNKYSVFDGIVQNKNPITGKSTYNTFRRVSDKSDPNSWIHPGIQAHNLMDEAWKKTEVDKIIDDAIEILF
jgi:hypothetical protein